MSRTSDRLRIRREALLRRANLQRQDLLDQLAQMGTRLDSADRGLGVLRRVATAPTLVAGGVLATLLLGRGRARRTMAAGAALLGVFLRARSTGQMLAQLARGQSSPAQAVRRTREP